MIRMYLSDSAVDLCRWHSQRSKRDDNISQSVGNKSFARAHHWIHWESLWIPSGSGDQVHRSTSTRSWGTPMAPSLKTCESRIMASLSPFSAERFHHFTASRSFADCRKSSPKNLQPKAQRNFKKNSAKSLFQLAQVALPDKTNLDVKKTKERMMGNDYLTTWIAMLLLLLLMSRRVNELYMYNTIACGRLCICPGTRYTVAASNLYGNQEVMFQHPETQRESKPTICPSLSLCV